LRLLLDTHALIWFFAGDERLPVNARKQIEDPDATVLVSAVSAMEVTLKHRLGKLPQAGRLALEFEDVIERYGFVGLPISLAHAESAGSLPIQHKDPFDRLLIAQALLDGLPLVSNERGFDDYGVSRLW
jgi:PIN domain nuclease of toxin-antitoxin system